MFPPPPAAALQPRGLQYTHWGVLGLPGAPGWPVGHLGLGNTLVWGVGGYGAKHLLSRGGGLVVRPLGLVRGAWKRSSRIGVLGGGRCGGPANVHPGDTPPGRAGRLVQ